MQGQEQEQEQHQVINPLHGLVSKPGRKKVTRPKWMCRHPLAELVDSVTMKYKCEICNPTNGYIRVIPTVTTKKRSPKPVTISPNGSSPVGFTDISNR